MTSADAGQGIEPRASEVDYDFPEAVVGTSIVITTNRSIHVRVMDDENYRLYRSGEDCRAFQGDVTTSPYRFRVPRDARWHVVIDPYTSFGLAEFTVRLIDDAVLSSADRA